MHPVAFNVRRSRAQRHIVALSGGVAPRFRRFYSRSWTLHCRRTRHSRCASLTPQSIPSPTTGVSRKRARMQALRHSKHQPPGKLLDLFSRNAGPQQSATPGSFALGNVTNPLEAVLAMPRFLALDDEIRAPCGAVATKKKRRKPTVTFRFAEEGHRATSFSKTGDFATTERSPVACTSRRPSMSRLISLNDLSP